MAAANADDGRRKELRVKIPLEQHLKLRSLKLLRGENMADTVQKALGLYFERMAQERGWTRVAEAGDLEA